MSTVFIPTRNRLDMLAKVLPKWKLQSKVDSVIIVTEPSEYGQHREFVKEWGFDAEVVRSNKSAGIGHKRNWIVRRAEKLGLRNFIMADDDLAPSPNTDITLLCKDLKKTDSIGIGGCRSIYGRFLGNDLLKNTNKTYLSPGGMGFGVYSLNVKLALELGNFDKNLHTRWEDAELVRIAMREFGMPWHIHSGAWFVSLNVRHAPGGLTDWAGSKDKRAELEKKCHDYLYFLWGERYISHPSKRAQCKWRNVFDDFVPNWREEAIWLKEKSK